MDPLLAQLRGIRDRFILRLQFQSAVFLSDKILAFSAHTDEDVLVLAKCLYRLREYQRAAFMITSRDLHHTNMACCLLVVKCHVSVLAKLRLQICFLY